MLSLALGGRETREELVIGCAILYCRYTSSSSIDISTADAILRKVVNRGLDLPRNIRLTWDRDTPERVDISVNGLSRFSYSSTDSGLRV